MFFIRSQPLKDGDKVGLIAFPGDSPYLVEVDVEKRETITVAGQPRPAIRLGFKLQKIETKGGAHLVEHQKFRNGTVWLSDDQDRIPLRAEVNIFVGFVYGELKSVTFGEGFPIGWEDEAPLGRYGNPSFPLFPSRWNFATTFPMTLHPKYSAR